MRLFKVSFGSHIVGSHDHVYVMADNEQMALRIAKPMLNTHKLNPDFLNQYGRYAVSKVN
jgi:hypothetical protein